MYHQWWDESKQNESAPTAEACQVHPVTKAAKDPHHRLVCTYVHITSIYMCTMYVDVSWSLRIHIMYLPIQVHVLTQGWMEGKKHLLLWTSVSFHMTATLQWMSYCMFYDVHILGLKCSMCSWITAWGKTKTNIFAHTSLRWRHSERLVFNEYTSFLSTDMSAIIYCPGQAEFPPGGSHPWRCWPILFLNIQQSV